MRFYFFFSLPSKRSTWLLVLNTAIPWNKWARKIPRIYVLTFDDSLKIFKGLWWKSQSLYEWTVSKCCFLKSTALYMRPHSTTRFSLLPLNIFHPPFVQSSVNIQTCEWFSARCVVSRFQVFTQLLNVKRIKTVLFWVSFGFFGILCWLGKMFQMF